MLVGRSASLTESALHRGEPEGKSYLSEVARKKDKVTLSRLAREFADEINNHDWSDAPYRCDRAGHQRSDDNRVVQQLTQQETDAIRMNVMWVTAQVLGYSDGNFDVYEFADACGVDTRTPTGRPKSGAILYGLRRKEDGEYYAPGRR